MTKTQKSVFVCGECGYETGKWMGKCPQCGSWNTLVEEAAVTVRPQSGAAKAMPLFNIGSGATKRVSTEIEELDRVLGGGVVPGSTILLGGDPGIGKSTLLMQAAANLTRHGKVLYVTGEESAAQLKLRAERLNLCSDQIFVLAETDLSIIESEAVSLKPSFMLIDSIQTMYCHEIGSAAGSVSQVREATSTLTQYAKSTGTSVFIVGHVTKEGAIAGPRILEHMVDTVLYFEGDRHDVYRILRSVKNRFGSTNEIGVFEMRDSGMAEVADPSLLFLSGTNRPGCVVTCAMEGTRPLLAEVQTLLSSTSFNNPRRMAAGLDTNRLILILAVLEKKAGLQLYDKDVYANVVGGLKLEERASDLAVALCIAASLFDVAMPSSTAAIGEVSLTGDVRMVNRLEKRVQECVRLGFSRIIVPFSPALPEVHGATLIAVKTLGEAVAMLAEKKRER